MKNLLEELTQELDGIRKHVIRPAEGLIKHDYLTPGGYYKQMWDWDGFFIGIHLATRNGKNAQYLKWWVLNFLETMDTDGYICGCVSPKKLRKIFGRFTMKPFLAQGCYHASVFSGDFEWIRAIYNKVTLVISYRERNLFDKRYGLFFWENAMQSGADNNVALSNEEKDRYAILACDMSTFQLREYQCMAHICSQLGYSSDEKYYNDKAVKLTEAIRKHLWFPEFDSFFNIWRETGKPIKRITYSNFIPLLSNLATQPEGERMINRYLWNTDHMLSNYGIRTLSRQDPDYSNKNTIVPFSNWQGPIWPIANFLYSEVLKNYGFIEESSLLAHAVGKLCLDDIRECGSMHENYHAETGEPLAPEIGKSKDGESQNFIGWNLLIENMVEGAYNGHTPLLKVPANPLKQLSDN